MSADTRRDFGELPNPARVARFMRWRAECGPDRSLLQGKPMTRHIDRMTTQDASELPGASLDVKRMPGHWLLARLGKRVLRPGGLDLTRQMVDALSITPRDRVVELAPGLGTTMRLTLARSPASYVGVERDEAAARRVRRSLRRGDECRRGDAARTGLADGSASVVYGEAMLTMQTTDHKLAIVREAHRVLEAGGRYGIHELALRPDELGEAEKSEIQRELSDVIHVGARPLTSREWVRVLESAGFEVEHTVMAPMHLLEPGRVLSDEGLLGALRIAVNILRSLAARQRVMAMRRVFRTYESKMCAIVIVARKPDHSG